MHSRCIFIHHELSPPTLELHVSETMSLPTLADNCTFYPSHTIDTSLCWQLGTPTRTEIPSPSSNAATVQNSLYYARYFSLTSYSRSGQQLPSDTRLVTETATDFDRCLPGPTSCTLVYTDAPCPTDYVQLSRAVQGTMTWDFCCLRYVILSAMKFVCACALLIEVEFRC